jgi:stage V sporulation protein G
MKITEVRIFPTESRDGKLKAFATMTFDDWFVVRNVKVIQGNSGLFVAMPSRKAMAPCPKCQSKNVVGSKYCNQCASELPGNQGAEMRDTDPHGSHMDIAHPITQDCRIYIQDKILEAYKKETGDKEAATATTKDINTGEKEARKIDSGVEDAQDIAL